MLALTTLLLAFERGKLLFVMVEHLPSPVDMDIVLALENLVGTVLSLLCFDRCADTIEIFTGGVAHSCCRSSSPFPDVTSTVESQP